MEKSCRRLFEEIYLEKMKKLEKAYIGTYLWKLAFGKDFQDHRQEYESAFSAYPLEKKAGVLGKVQSDDEKSHIPALCELRVFSLLRRFFKKDGEILIEPQGLELVDFLIPGFFALEVYTPLYQEQPEVTQLLGYLKNKFHKPDKIRVGLYSIDHPLNPHEDINDFKAKRVDPKFIQAEIFKEMEIFKTAPPPRGLKNFTIITPTNDKVSGFIFESDEPGPPITYNSFNSGAINDDRNPPQMICLAGIEVKHHKIKIPKLGGLPYILVVKNWNTVLDVGDYFKEITHWLGFGVNDRKTEFFAPRMSGLLVSRKGSSHLFDFFENHNAEVPLKADTKEKIDKIFCGGSIQESEKEPGKIDRKQAQVEPFSEEDV